jgi:hypothetical protein
MILWFGQTSTKIVGRWDWLSQEIIRRNYQHLKKNYLRSSRLLRKILNLTHRIICDAVCKILYRQMNSFFWKTGETIFYLPTAFHLIFLVTPITAWMFQYPNCVVYQRLDSNQMWWCSGVIKKKDNRLQLNLKYYQVVKLLDKNRTLRK